MRYNNDVMNGKDIKEIRKKLDFSQERLAQELHVSLNTVNRWEHDITHPNQLSMWSIKSVMAKYGMEVK